MHNSTRTELQLPIWSIVAASALLAIATKPKPRWQFGLRELFVLSTIMAITVGTLVVLLRAIGS